MACVLHEISYVLERLDEERMIGMKAPTSCGSWPILSLLLTIAFLGHDLLMTSHPAAHITHAADSAMATDGSMRDAAPADALAPESGETFHINDALDGCGYDRVAVLISNDGAHLTSDGSLRAFPRAVLLSGQRRLAVDEPTAPPGVRRALFQVFLI